MSRELETHILGARPPEDDVDARTWLAEVETKLFGAPRDPVRVGRYVVLERIGSGGIGVVYAAYDPELDRKVALKLLQPRADRGGAGTDARARLVREAQAMAKVAHPNVVAVHDVGTWEDQVYVAMELVAGPTLAAWLRAGPHPWRETLHVLVQAGLGLAAAHDAGLVHRDFKPSNVLVAEDGRVRVLDFGLAKRRGHPDENLPVPQQTATASSDFTETGSIMGTLPYMAPEQHAGAPIDARADQYAFCITSWEALFGHRPFEGSSAEILEQRKRAFEIAELGDDVRVPRRIVRAVLRGLSPQPDDRWPDMGALLAELARDHLRRWRNIGALVGSGALVAGGLGLWLSDPEPSDRDPCREPTRQIDEVWNEGTRARLETALVGSAPGSGRQPWHRIERALDAYASSWTERRERACRTRMTSSDAHSVDRTTELCLDRRLQDFAQTIAVLRGSTHLDDASYAVASLPPLSTCDPPPVATPVVETVVEPTEALLARARALERAARYEEALAVVRDAIDQAHASGSLRTEARGRLTEGMLLDEVGSLEEAEVALRKALALAERAEDDDTAARALIELVYVVGSGQTRHDEAHHWAELARAKIARRGDPAHLTGEYFNALGVLLSAQRRYDEAERAYLRAMELRRMQTGGDHVLVASSLNNLGTVAIQRRQPARARDHLTRALAVYEQALGAEHPRVAPVRANLAEALLKADLVDEALVQYEQALGALRAAHGDDHPQVIGFRNNMGALLYRHADDLPRARVMLETALESAQRTFGESHPMVCGISTNLGDVVRLLGDLDEALRLHQRAIAGWEAAFGPDHPDLVHALVNAAKVHAELGDASAAKTALDRAETLLQHGLGTDHPLADEIRSLRETIAP